MAAVLHYGVFVLLLVVGIEGVKITRMTADEFFSSALWKDASKTLLILGEVGYPPDHLTTVREHLKGTTAAVVQVLCGETGGGSELCQILSSHPAAVRRGRGLRGVSLDDGGIPLQFTASALEALLGDQVTHVHAHNEYRQYTSSHPPHLLALTSSTVSPEYLSLLIALLSAPIHLVVTMATEVLPLPYRPPHTITPFPLHLWFVSGRQWVRYNPAQNALELFLKRTKFPLSVEYESEATLAVFSGSGLNVAYFCGLGEEQMKEQLVGELAETHYQQFAFITIKKDACSTVAEQLHLKHKVDSSTHPFIAVQTPDKKLHIVESSGRHFGFEVERVSDIFMQIAEKRSSSLDGHMAGDEDPPPLSIADPGSLVLLARESRVDVLAVFCKLGTRGCPDRFYGKMEKVVHTLTQTGHMDRMAAFVVETVSVQDIRQFQVTSLPSMALYDRREGKWRGESGAEGTVIDYINFATQGKLQDGISMDDFQDGRHSDRDPMPRDYSPTQLREDDHFGLLLRTLPPPSPPLHLQLTDKTLTSHVATHRKTAVMFYISWDVKSRVFLHHFMAAVENLDPALNCSLVLVSCDRYPDVCALYNITTYPSVRVFHGSSLLPPTPLTGALDSAHLLSALGQHTLPLQSKTVPELRADTLPTLLQGDLGTRVVVWCGKMEEEEVEEVFVRAANSPEFEHLTFAWLDSEKYSYLLERVAGEVVFPAVLALDFRQHKVYVLEVPLSESSLHLFLSQLTQNELKHTGTLPHKTWPPLQPPIQFPSGQAHFGMEYDSPFPSTPTTHTDTPHHHHHSHTEL